MEKGETREKREGGAGKLMKFASGLQGESTSAEVNLELGVCPSCFLFLSLARLPYSSSLKKIGLAYLEGRGVGIDSNLAMKYFTLAADMGDSSAQYHLGKL